MIDFETWWNSSSADEFRRLNDDMDGRVVRPVWDAAIRATLSSQKATSAAPSPEATQPTQAEAPAQADQGGRGDDWPAELSGDRTERARFGVVVDSVAGLWIDDDDFIFDASIKVDGDFPDDATKRKYLDEIVRRLNGRAPATYQAGRGGQGVVDSEFIHELLWGEYPECCGNPVVGAEYMGQEEMVCCGCPEPSQLSDAQIVAALRERFPEAAAPEAPAQPTQVEAPSNGCECVNCSNGYGECQRIISQAEAPSEFPLSAWQTMEYAKGALNAMLTHMGMDEDEWNKPSFEQARSAVRTLEYQLQRPDQVALWKARYQSLKGPLSKFHEQAVAAGFDGVGSALAALATQQAVQGEAVLPRPGSPEASAMIDSLLAEYQWPSNPKNAARAGFEAARRMLATPPAPGQVERDREDAELLDWLDAKNKPFKMGWQVGVAPAGNVVVKSVIYPTTEPVAIRSAIRAARSSEGGSND